MATRPATMPNIAAIPISVEAFSRSELDSDRPYVLASGIDAALETLSVSFFDELQQRRQRAIQYLSADDDERILPLLGLERSANSRMQLIPNLTRSFLDANGNDLGQFTDLDQLLFHAQWDTSFARLVITEIRFEQGSLKAFLSGAIVTGILVPITISLAGPIVAQMHADHRANVQIAHVLKDSRCATDLRFTTDIGKVRQLAARQLDPEESGLDPASVGLRTCNLQFALRAVGHSSGAIDGALGAQTRAALDRYRKDKSLENYSRFSPVVLDSLAQEASRAFEP